MSYVPNGRLSPCAQHTPTLAHHATPTQQEQGESRPSVSRKRSAGRDATSTPLKRHRSNSIDADPGEVDDEDWQPEQDGDESATVKKELTYDEDAQVDDADPDGGFDASYDSSTSANDTRTPGSKQVGTRCLSFAISQ